MDLEALKSLSKYKTAAGRKKSSAVQQSDEDTQTISAVDAAEILGINVQQLRVLFERKILIRVPTLDRAVMVDKKSVMDLRNTLDRCDLLSVAEAAARLHQTPEQFERNWIKRGVLEAMDLVHWRYIKSADLEKLQREIAGRVTASMAGKMLGVHRSHLPNLERRGEVKSIRLGDVNGGIRLYELGDLET